MKNNKQERVLVLPLKKKWFEMIKSGEKKEEYREINDYWKKRLTFTNELFGLIMCKHYDKVEFTLGYPRKDDKERRITFDCPAITVGEGKPEWGAEPGKNYFVITWDRCDEDKCCSNCIKYEVLNTDIYARCCKHGFTYEKDEVDTMGTCCVEWEGGEDE